MSRRLRRKSESLKTLSPNTLNSNTLGVGGAEIICIKTYLCSGETFQGPQQQPSKQLLLMDLTHPK